MGALSLSLGTNNLTWTRKSAIVARVAQKRSMPMQFEYRLNDWNQVVPAKVTKPPVTSPATSPSALMYAQPRDVARWLSTHGEPVRGPVTIKRIGFGQSNITSLITDSDGRAW